MSAFYTGQVERAAGQAAQRRAVKLAREKRITVEPRLSGAWHEILLTAPAGYTLDDVHEHVVANAGPTTDGLWQDVEQRVRLALVPCNVPGCDWCADDSASECATRA